MTSISFLGFLLGLLLVVVPVYIVYFFKLDLMEHFLKAFLKLFVFMGVAFVVFRFVFQANLMWVNLLVALLFTVMTAAFTLGRARVLKMKMLLPLTVGVLVPVLFVSIYFVLVVFGQNNPFDARWFLPMIGMSAGAVIGINGRALHTYYMGLAHHSQLYYYLLGNGATHHEAVNYFVRRSLQTSFASCLGQMGYILVAVCPVAFWVSMLCGADAFTAAALQILLFVVLLFVASSSLVLTLLLARRYSFDEYESLKQVVKMCESKKVEIQPSANDEVKDVPRSTDEGGEDVPMSSDEDV